MPAREGKADRNTLVFDAFARVSASDKLIVSWPDVQLDAEQAALIDSLVDKLGFLGRAESWVEARRLEAWDGEPNCITRRHRRRGLGERAAAHPDDAHADGRLCGLPSSAIGRAEEALGPQTQRQKGHRATLPESWLDAIGVESADLRAAGWNIPPASRNIPYRVRDEILRSSGKPSSPPASGTSATTFRFAVYGKLLPRVEDTVRMGEWLRAATMSQAKKLLGENAVPPLISGHGLPDDNRHEHAFWLPEDADGDGKIDHLIVHIPALRKDFMDVPESLKNSARQAIKGIRRLRNREGQEWTLWLKGAGQPEDFANPNRQDRKSVARVQASSASRPTSCLGTLT